MSWRLRLDTLRLQLTNAWLEYPLDEVRISRINSDIIEALAESGLGSPKIVHDPAIEEAKKEKRRLAAKMNRDKRKRERAIGAGL
jgi:hypothetical protein